MIFSELKHTEMKKNYKKHHSHHLFKLNAKKRLRIAIISP